MKGGSFRAPRAAALLGGLIGALLAGESVGCKRAAPSPDAAPVVSASARSSGGLAGLHIEPGRLGLGGQQPLTIPSGDAAPMPSGTTDTEREKEIIALLSGKVGPDALPVVPTDPGVEYDEGLRRTLLSATRYEPSVSLGNLKIEGELAVSDATRVTANSRGRLRACFRAALHETPSLRGTLRLRLAIAPSGEVTSADVVPMPGKQDSVASSAGLKACASRSVRALLFPAAEGRARALSLDAAFTPDDDSAKRR